jgi:UDP-N-acetylglucosamine 2-epimerase (non-hydrolysing)/GDP/UDP-N,N'-diacetylbacillosamine 2-epimerase (hydrolysing)
MRRRICVITGSRAEYGLLYWVMKEIAAEPALELKLLATGAHFAPEFGETWRAIEDDGFTIDERVEMQLSGDSPVAVAKSMGLALIGIADALARLRPDIVLLLGDRYEIFAAAAAASVARIPLAHIAGGDRTEGAIDEAFRHAITKMAHLHFVTNADAARRVRQLGEDAERIHVVGSPGLDHIGRTRLLCRSELEEELGFPFHARNLLVTYHPETLSLLRPLDEFKQILEALDALGSNVGLIVTRPNADAGARALIEALDAFAASRSNVLAVANLGTRACLSTLAQVDAVVGNSSSGLYEAPSFRIPTVNIGGRQNGRLRAASVIDCPAEKDAIIAAVQQAFAADCSKVVNPYGDGGAAPRIVAALRAVSDPAALLRKRFHDLAGSAALPSPA